MKASKLLDEAMKQKPLTITQLGLNVDKAFEEWYHVGRVLVFFQKLGVYLQAGYLDRELARQLMGDTVLLWYDSYFANMSQDDDLTKEHMGPFLAINEWLKPYRAQVEAAKKATGTKS